MYILFEILSEAMFNFKVIGFSICFFVCSKCCKCCKSFIYHFCIDQKLDLDDILRVIILSSQ